MQSVISEEHKVIDQLMKQTFPIEQLIMSRSNWFTTLKMAFDSVVVKQRTMYHLEVNSISKLDYLDSIA